MCVFSFDYLFLDASGRKVEREKLSATREEVDLTLLVVRDSKGKSLFGHVVPQKGVDQDNYAVDILLADLKWLGYQRISLRSDNEPAILNLLKHAASEARLQMVDLQQLTEEHPNVYDSSGNGEIEVAVKQLTGVLRTNKLDLERRLGMVVPQDHPVMTWLVECSAWMVTIRTRGVDGLTAYQRVRGRDYTKRVVPFGELVLVHLPAKGPERRAGGALDARTKEGVVLGYGTVSNSYCVFVDNAVRYCRSIQRMPLSRRWVAASVEAVNVSRRDLHDARGARRVPFTDRPDAPDDQPRHRRAARKLELRQGDFDPAMGGHGWTENCTKCDRARLHGWREALNMQHSSACRDRIEAELGGTELGRARLERTKERIDRYTADLHEERQDAVEPAQPVRFEGEIDIPPHLRNSDGNVNLPDDFEGVQGAIGALLTRRLPKLQERIVAPGTL